MNILEIENLSLEFGGLKVLTDLNFSVKKGEIYSIIGPNGAGKTSLYNCISGFYFPSSGSVKFNGKEMLGMKPHKIAEAGVIRTFQNLRIFSDMTVVENVMTSMYCRKKSTIFDSMLQTKRHKDEEKQCLEAAMKCLKMIDMEKYAAQAASKLPYGDQKRLEIARALAIEPEIILLDEPAAGLNHDEKGQLIKIIRDIKNLGITVLLIEHDMGLVMEVSERIFVLNYGKKIAEGSPNEIRSNAAVVEAYLGREN